ncbi:MAG TPA: hypothetical protein VIN07_03855 [Flavipsychrobacter sp.]
MTKPRKTNENSSAPESLAPVSVTQTESEKAKELNIDVPPGHVYIVGLNVDGTEKEGSGFFYPEKSYQRIYGDETKYSIKKKAH